MGPPAWLLTRHLVGTQIPYPERGCDHGHQLRKGPGVSWERTRGADGAGRTWRACWQGHLGHMHTLAQYALRHAVALPCMPAGEVAALRVTSPPAATHPLSLGVVFSAHFIE